MSTAPFQQGDKVVCIRDDWYLPDDCLGVIPPVKDHIYSVREVIAYPGLSPSLRLVGIILPLHPVLRAEWGWTSDWFRRVWTQEVGESLVTTNSDSATL